MSEETNIEVRLEQAKRLNAALQDQLNDLRRQNVQLEIKFLEAHIAAAEARIAYLKVTNV